MGAEMGGAGRNNGSLLSLLLHSSPIGTSAPRLCIVIIELALVIFLHILIILLVMASHENSNNSNCNIAYSLQWSAN